MPSRRVVATIAIAAAGVLGLAGCTSGSSTSAPTSRASSPTAPGTVTGTAPTAPVNSAAATCAPGSTTLTFHRHRTVIDGYEYGLPPGGRTTTYHRPVITVVRAQAPGLGSGSGLISAVGKHWHTTAVALGSTTRHDAGGKITLHDPSSTKNEVGVVYDFVHVFTGQFASACGGAHVTGRYTTFGDVGTVVVGCGDKIKGTLDRLGHRLCS